MQPTARSPAHAAHRTEPSACSPPHRAQRMQPTASSPLAAWAVRLGERAHWARLDPRSLFTGGVGARAWTGGGLAGQLLWIRGERGGRGDRTHGARGRICLWDARSLMSARRHAACHFCCLARRHHALRYHPPRRHAPCRHQHAEIAATPIPCGLACGICPFGCRACCYPPHYYWWCHRRCAAPGSPGADAMALMVIVWRA